MKNTLGGINSRLGNTENDRLEDTLVEISQKKKKILKNKDSSE